MNRPAGAWKVYLAIFTSIFFWGIAFLAIKIALRELTPFELTALRFLPLVPLCLIYLWARSGETLEILRRHPAQITIISLLMIPAYNWLLYTGQKRIPPSLAALLIGASPLLTYLIAVIIKEERPRLPKFLGIITAFLGLGIAMELGSQAPLKAGMVFYALLAFGASVSAAVYTVMSHSLLKKHSPVLLMSLAIPLGSIPLLATLPPSLLPKIRGLAFPTWASLGFLATLATLVGFNTWFYALKRLPPSQVIVFVNLVPFLTMIFGYLFFEEKLTAPLLLGGILVVLGVYQTNRRS